jgi:beta-lactamase superfamily II metal-dependent hydrolase
VATHHGANFDNNNYPIPVSKNGYIAYSHGNGYGHPTTLSINAHINAGWKTRRETIKGNIIFKVGATNLGIKCKSSLRIKQTF